MNEILEKLKFLEEIKGRMSNIEREIGLVYDLIIKEAKEGEKEIKAFAKEMDDSVPHFDSKGKSMISCIGYRGED
jgi:hypothetical protein